jgi:biopolymer transport protein ExbB
MTLTQARLRIALFLLGAVSGATLPSAAHAWWNADFSERTKITLNTSSAGIATTEALSGTAVPVRLHSGNFDFVAAKPDGSDLRVVAGDDKTPLKFWLERYDSANELAVLWVLVPTVAPGSDKNLIYVYAGNDKAAAEATAPVVDSSTLATFRFNDAKGAVRDLAGTMDSTAPASIDINGLIGGSARLDGTQAIDLPASTAVRTAGAGPYSVSMWVKPAGAGGTPFSQGPLSIALQGDKVVVRIAKLQVEGGALPPSAWAHIGLTLGDGKVLLYVNGAQAGQADVPASSPPIEGPLRLGQGYSGLLDELEIASVLRSADWMKFTRASQGADAKLVASQLQRSGDAAEGEGAGSGYIGVLARSLTLDAKVVIGILAVMLVIAIWVMITKTLLVLRTDKGNRGFLAAFRDANDVMAAGGEAQHAGSSLARLYDTGLKQLNKRKVGQTGAKAMSSAALDAIKASIDADLVRENHKLNASMVLLTIAISGGPFLGLLGTVVGVMITFAAIAAAGDVNVNAIAPGIAAALLATVAGLGVAIPALFGYNWLASKIKNISSDMQIFVDEFVTRVAENYGEP